MAELTPIKVRTYQITNVCVCSDGYTCTADLCVVLPSVEGTAGSAEDANGCFFDKTGGVPCVAPRECAVVECIAGPSALDGTGCVYTEKPNYCKYVSSPMALMPL